MEIDLTISWTVIFGFIGICGTVIATGWRLFARVGRNQQGVDDAKTMARGAEAMAKLTSERLNEFEKHVASNYASNKQTEAMEGRIIGAVDRLGEHIDRMGERIDRLFDAKKP